MDLLRAALGQSRISYLGQSYGTVLGASYIQQFPHRVRAAVLDGAVAPGLSRLDDDITQAQGFSVAFGQFVSWCLGQRGCPLRGPAPAAVRQVSALITRANARPLTNKLPALPHSRRQLADGAMLLNGITAALYAKAWWPALKQGLAAALGAGDGTVLVNLTNGLLGRHADGSYSNLTDILYAVGCIDESSPKSIAAYQAAAAAAAKAAPLFGPSSVYGSLVCAYWPVAPHPVLSGRAPSGLPPVLVAGELHDPATPYAWAVALARWLRQGGNQQGVLLGWNGQGHTSYGMGSKCVDNAVDAYLISLRAPVDGTVCD
jgi:pimeloyl-ACP methyl ester carboxylesterase